MVLVVGCLYVFDLHPVTICVLQVAIGVIQVDGVEGLQLAADIPMARYLFQLPMFIIGRFRGNCLTVRPQRGIALSEPVIGHELRVLWIVALFLSGLSDLLTASTSTPHLERRTHCLP